MTEAHLMSGRAAEEIIFLAEQVGADLGVVGSRGLGGIRRALMGSVSDSVLDMLTARSYWCVGRVFRSLYEELA